MKTRSHAADYYRRILSVQPHGLKRLDPVAAILHCNRGQEIPNSPGPAGHWYYVIVGAVRRCTIRSDGRRQIVDLMLPQDFFFVADSMREGTIEAVVEETVLASYPGARVEQLAERDPLPGPGYVLLRYADSPNCLIVSDGRRSVSRNGAFLCTRGNSRDKRMRS